MRSLLPMSMGMPFNWILLDRNRLRSNLRSGARALRDGLDLEPDGIQSRQEDEREDGPAERSADQRVRQRSPENRVSERNECQHRSKRGQNHRTGALHGGLDHGGEWRQSILLVLA